jgi:hypothetical protein
MTNPLEKAAEFIVHKFFRIKLLAEQGSSMVFNIDLLKGQGIPIKTSPHGVAIIAVGIVIPLVVALIMTGIFLKNRVIIPIKEHEVAVYNQKMQTLSEGVKAQQMFDKNRESINASVPETAAAVRKFTAWSPVIRTIAENMPGAMVLSRLDAKQTASAQQGTGTPSVSREVEMSISGKAGGNWDEDVKGFRSRLLESGTLKSRLQDIPVAQQSSKGGQNDAVNYDLRMLFRDGM